MLLSAALRFGWRWILAASGCVWLLAQFGLRDLVHNWVVQVTHLNIPLQETGAFNLFAWQAVWTVGLWVGARSAMRRRTFSDPPGWLAATCCALCLFFIGIRWGWLGPHLTQPALGLQLDKWQIGPLRLINLVTFSIVVYWLRRRLIKIVLIEPFLTLGKASLQVFCTHIVFVFVGLALLVRDVGDDVGQPLEQLHGRAAIILLIVTFTALLLVALREVRGRGTKGKPGGQDPKTESSDGNPPNCSHIAERHADAAGREPVPGVEALPAPVVAEKGTC
jgi:hypothetical protein